MDIVQELTLAMQETEEAYNILDKITYYKPFPTNYDRHQAENYIRYAEEKENELFKTFCLCYF